MASKPKHLKKPNTNSATQSNQLIEAAYKMTIPAKRVMLLLLGQIHPMQQDVSQKVVIKADDYARRTGLSLDQSYRDIKNGCFELMSTIITTRNIVEKTTEKCVVVSWMKYHDNEGWLEATFTSWIAPYIHALSRMGYTTIAIDEAVKFKRFYTIRFYELLMQYKSTGVLLISLNELRKVFQIEPEKYAMYADFKKYVLTPSLKELSEKIGLLVKCQPTKTGRKITGFKFCFNYSREKDAISALVAEE
jgi:plasmid replication initiation protein